MRSLFLLRVALMLPLVGSGVYSHAACGDGYRPETIPALTLDEQQPMVVSMPVEFRVGIPAAEFNQRLKAAPLERLLPGTDKIPGVVGTHALTARAFGAPGAPRLVCLADGTTAVEEVIEDKPGERFRYKVWHYTTPAARPVEYAIGEFQVRAADSRSAVVTWTYAFKLRSGQFPGFLGPVGRWLFKQQFIDSDFSPMMRVSAAAMSAYFVRQ